MTAETASLKQVLGGEGPVIVAEYEPPTMADGKLVREAAAQLKGKVHAVGVVDNRAEIRMSAVAAAAILRGEGLEPIVHMTVRDRNRIALISDVLGAHAMGLSNILCTTGDHQTLGRERTARNVFDLDAIQLLATLNGIRQDGTLFGNGREVGKCEFCLGATASPIADPPELQTLRMAKKVSAGADFFVTQPVFDVDGFNEWLGSLNGIGEVPVLAGILAPPTASRAKEINETVPGVEIPESVIQRLESAGSAGEKAEAVKIAAEIVNKLKDLNGVKGLCLMADGDVAMTCEIIDQAGLKV